MGKILLKIKTLFYSYIQNLTHFILMIQEQKSIQSIIMKNKMKL